MSDDRLSPMSVLTDAFSAVERGRVPESREEAAHLVTLNFISTVSFFQNARYANKLLACREEARKQNADGKVKRSQCLRERDSLASAMLLSSDFATTTCSSEVDALHRAVYRGDASNYESVSTNLAQCMTQATMRSPLGTTAIPSSVVDSLRERARSA